MQALPEESKVFQPAKAILSAVKKARKGMFQSIPFLVFPVSIAFFSPSQLLPVELPYEAQKFNLAPHIQYLTVEQNISLEEAQQSGDWKNLEKINADFGYASHQFWFRTEIENSQFPATWLLNLNANQLDHVDFYIEDNGEFIHSIAGDHHPFPEWGYPYSSPTVKIHLNKGETKAVYFHVKSESVISFWIRTYRESGFAEMKLKNSYTNWFYLFSSSVCILFLIYLGLITGDRRFYFLISLVVNTALYFMMIAGNSYVLWPEIPWLQDRLLLLLAAALLHQVIFILIGFLQLAEISRFLYYLYITLFILVFPVYLSAIEQTSFHLQWLIGIGFVSYPIFLLTAAYLIIRKGSYVKYLFLLLIVVGSSLFIRAMTLSGILPYLEITYNSGPYIFPFLLILIVSVIHEKNKIVQAEKENLENEYRRISLELEKKNSISRIESLDVNKILRKIHIISKTGEIFQINYSLQKMADRIDIRPDQLSEVFSRILNTSYPQFIKTLRIHHAKNLIEQFPDKKIIDISFESGFGSKAAFNQAFKEITHLPPSDFRKDKQSADRDMNE